MTSGPLAPFVSARDFSRRASMPLTWWSVTLAEHLRQHPQLELVEPLLADMRAGRALERHLSPLKVQRAAFKRAHKKQHWVLYRKFMDHLLNKWGFRHFHCATGSLLVFVYLCDRTNNAMVVDFVSHNGNWCIEKRLVEIAARNWPDAGIAAAFGQGWSKMTEEDFLLARKQGLNMTVNVDGTYYLPARSALMSDGTRSELGVIAPIFVMGRRFNRDEKPGLWPESPTALILGLDPDDPRSPQIMAAGQMGLLNASGRR